MVNKIKAADRGLNDIRTIAGGKIIRTEDNRWKCTICQKIMNQGKSLIGHMGQHNKGSGSKKQKETKEKANKKGYVRKKEKTIEQRKRIEKPKETEDEEEIPEIIKVEVFLGRIKRCEGENVKWECSKCKKNWEKPRSTLIHVSKCQKFKMENEDETGRHMICPYCKNMFQERKTLTAHLFRDTCYEYEKIRESKTGEETWKDIVEANEKKT